MRARRARFTSLGGECSGALSGGGVSRSRGSPSKDQVRGSPGDARPDRGDSGRGDAARESSVKLRRPSDGRRFRGRASGWGVTTGSWGRRALTGVAALPSILVDEKGQPLAGAFPAGSGGSGGAGGCGGGSGVGSGGGDLGAARRSAEFACSLTPEIRATEPGKALF